MTRSASHTSACCATTSRATRAELEARGVEFLTTGIADVAGLRTTWCRDPWGTVIILLQKSEDARPYWGQLLP